MGELPAGTITMLFTDIEGSTALLRRLGGRYADALSAQRALLRDAFANCGGHEMGTEGDSFFIVFGSAADAVRCCVAAQRALSGHDWPGGIPVRVRMGLHSGEPVRHEDGYVGLDVHRAARIAAVAHGGQVVLSEATRQLAGSRLPAGASLRDLGLHRLKDIEAPEHIYQLVAAGLLERFPPLNSTLAEATAPAAAGAVPIVGRVPERKALLAAYARVVAGHPQVLLVTGQLALARPRSSRNSAPRPSRPLAAPRSSSASRRHWLAPRSPTGPSWPPCATRRDGCSTTTARRTCWPPGTGCSCACSSCWRASPPGHGRVVLEDLHWADDSSRELLAFLAVRLHDQPVMLVGTLREEELAGNVGRWLAELERRPRVTRLRLGRLPDGEIAELVTGLLPADAASEDRVAAMVGAADGNPLYARELAHAGPQALPASISDAVLAKTAGLTAQARAVVDQICVADGGMSHELLAAAIPLPEKRLLASARQAVASGLLVPVTDGYAFNHTLTRQVLYADLLPGQRRSPAPPSRGGPRRAAGLRPRAAGPALAPGQLAGAGWAGGRAGGAPSGRGTRLPGGRAVLRARHRASRLAAGGGPRPAGGGRARRGLGGRPGPCRGVDS